MAFATGHSQTPATNGAGTAPSSLAAWFATLAALVGNSVAKARAGAELHRLDDRALRDIGVHRNEISSLLHYHHHDPSRRLR